MREPRYSRCIVVCVRVNASVKKHINSGHPCMSDLEHVWRLAGGRRDGTGSDRPGVLASMFHYPRDRELHHRGTSNWECEGSRIWSKPTIVLSAVSISWSLHKLRSIGAKRLRCSNPRDWGGGILVAEHDWVKDTLLQLSRLVSILLCTQDGVGIW